MKTLQDVQVGDGIVMVYRTGSTNDGKSTDRIVRAVVTAAKRVNLSIQESGHPGGWDHRRAWTIRRDTSKESGNQSMDGWRAYTVEQHGYLRGEAEAWTFLTKQGIVIRSGSPWSERRAELADLIRNHLESEATE